MNDVVLGALMAPLIILAAGLGMYWWVVRTDPADKPKR